jgi:hypothetical protein
MSLGRNEFARSAITGSQPRMSTLELEASPPAHAGSEPSIFGQFPCIFGTAKGHRTCCPVLQLIQHAVPRGVVRRWHRGTHSQERQQQHRGPAPAGVLQSGAVLAQCQDTLALCKNRLAIQWEVYHVARRGLRCVQPLSRYEKKKLEEPPGHHEGFPIRRGNPRGGNPGFHPLGDSTCHRDGGRVGRRARGAPRVPGDGATLSFRDREGGQASPRAVREGALRAGRILC